MLRQISLHCFVNLHFPSAQHEEASNFSCSYQLEYDPPGLPVNTNKVTPSGKSNSRILAIRKPRNGIIAKYQIKVRQPNQSRYICFRPICKRLCHSVALLLTFEESSFNFRTKWLLEYDYLVNDCNRTCNIKLFSVAPFMGSWHTRYTIWNK